MIVTMSLDNAERHVITVVFTCHGPWQAKRVMGSSKYCLTLLYFLLALARFAVDIAPSAGNAETKA